MKFSDMADKEFTNELILDDNLEISLKSTT